MLRIAGPEAGERGGLPGAGAGSQQARVTVEVKDGAEDAFSGEAVDDGGGVDGAEVFRMRAIDQDEVFRYAAAQLVDGRENAGIGRAGLDGACDVDFLVLILFAAAHAHGDVPGNGREPGVVGDIR